MEVAMDKFNGIFKKDKGQAAVEFALVLPILLLIICGIIDFGWILGNRLLVSYCTREGARYGSVVASETNSTSLITQRILNVAPAYAKDGLTINVAFSDPVDPQDGDVIVDVSYKANVLTPIGQIIMNGSTVNLDSECVMKVE